MLVCLPRASDRTRGGHLSPTCTIRMPRSSFMIRGTAASLVLHDTSPVSASV